MNGSKSFLAWWKTLPGILKGVAARLPDKAIDTPASLQTK